MKEIPLSRGLVALVGDDDFEVLNQFKWHVNSYGYAVREIPNEASPGKVHKIYMHRSVMGLDLGDKRQVDHRNENKLDNRRSVNLRFCTHTENQRNRGTQVNNTSGYKGVRWASRDQKWRADITVNGTRKYLGAFESPDTAHEAYCAAAAKYHDAFANFGSDAVRGVQI